MTLSAVGTKAPTYTVPDRITSFSALYNNAKVNYKIHSVIYAQ